MGFMHLPDGIAIPVSPVPMFWSYHLRFVTVMLNNHIDERDLSGWIKVRTIVSVQHCSSYSPNRTFPFFSSSVISVQYYYM